MVTMLEKFAERKYPGALRSIYELIGKNAPTPKEISTWKETWQDNGQRVVVFNFAKASDLCEELGIHYNLFQYKIWQRENENTEYSLVFYFEEDEIMFKMVKPHGV